MPLKRPNKFLLIVFVVFLCALIFLVILAFVFGAHLGEPIEEYLFSTQSPNGETLLNIYRVNSGATADYSIKVYIIESSKRKLIYNAYHENSAEVQWVTDEIVIINGRELNIAHGETYDWRKTD